MRVGQCIRAWREKRDLSVRVVAPMVGVSVATLSRIERGEQVDAYTQLKLIVFLFGDDESSKNTKESTIKRRCEYCGHDVDPRDPFHVHGHSECLCGEKPVHNAHLHDAEPVQPGEISGDPDYGESDHHLRSRRSAAS